jgi:hypothetical protein
MSTSPGTPTPEDRGSVSGAPNLPSGLREDYAEVGDDVRLHYVEAGDGPPIILPHGFPEFWYGWRLQIEPLVAAESRGKSPDASLTKPPNVKAASGVRSSTLDQRKRALHRSEGRIR